MTTAQVVETSVTVNNNSPIQDYIHPDDQTQPTENPVTFHCEKCCTVLYVPDSMIMIIPAILSSESQ